MRKKTYSLIFVNYPISFLRDCFSVISVRLIAIVVKYFYNRVRVSVLERHDYDSPKFFAPRVPDLKYDLTISRSNRFFLQILPTIKRLYYIIIQ